MRSDLGEAKLVLPGELATPEIEEMLEEYNRYQGFGTPVRNTKDPKNNWVLTINLAKKEELLAKLTELGWTQTDDIMKVW